MPDADFDRFFAGFRARHAWLPEQMARRYARSYGTLADKMLDGARSDADLGRHFGGGLYEREVAYLADNEWAMTAQDILWRRSKLGLHVAAEVADEIDGWLARRHRAELLEAGE
jgi:glycerol-3-phosphate dehydrogenase